MSAPIVLIVSVEIKPDRIEDFLRVIEEDAIGSREREDGGCLRFDVIRDVSDSNKFIFYEVYLNEDAIARHREMPHFQLWKEFRESGGVANFSCVKGSGTFYQF